MLLPGCRRLPCRSSLPFSTAPLLLLLPHWLADCSAASRGSPATPCSPSLPEGCTDLRGWFQAAVPAVSSPAPSFPCTYTFSTSEFSLFPQHSSAAVPAVLSPAPSFPRTYTFSMSEFSFSPQYSSPFCNNLHALSILLCQNTSSTNPLRPAPTLRSRQA